MHHKVFRVEISTFKKISKIENTWHKDDYQALLALMELDEGLEGMDTAELKEMCLMSLSDFEPDEAAKFVLTHLFSSEITEGKIDQISHQMAEDHLWETYPDYHFHQRLFNAYGLLREAFNGGFTQPSGVLFNVKITAKNSSDLALFEDSLQPTLVRLLAGGLDANKILNRLYEDQIAGDQFAEACGILWEITPLPATENSREYQLSSSEFWFGDLAENPVFEAKTHADKVMNEPH